MLEREGLKHCKVMDYKVKVIKEVREGEQSVMDSRKKKCQ